MDYILVKTNLEEEPWFSPGFVSVTNKAHYVFAMFGMIVWFCLKGFFFIFISLLKRCLVRFDDFLDD